MTLTHSIQRSSGPARSGRPTSSKDLRCGVRLTTVSPSIRRAVTLVEVVFSIAVILIGLVGLVSILPLAGRRAQEAVTMNVGAEFGDAVLKEIQIRRWIQNQQLIDYDTLEALKYEPGLTTGPSLTLTDADADENLHPKVSGVCIDPLYVADRVDQGETALAVNGYYDAVFPY